MVKELLQLFKNTYGKTAEIFSQAPGRLEILGNHTDYNEGFVLSMAVNCHTFLALRKIEGDHCKIISPKIENEIRLFNLNDLSDHASNHDWINYIKGVLREFQKKGYPLPAFEAAILSTLPLSAGMSSSASLEMALVKGFSKLVDLDIQLIEMAQIGQSCENNYIGANTGLMDQFTSLAGRKDCFVLSEYRNFSVKTVPIPENMSLLVFNSGIKHDLSVEYNERRQQCNESVKILKKTIPNILSLRDVSLQQLETNKCYLDEDVYRRALHVVEENNRVHKALSYLEKKDLKSFGQLLFKSHQSSIHNFENSCNELNFLVDTAVSSPLCLGARLSGGGFGGISIHLIENQFSREYQTLVQNTFEKKYGYVPDSFICQSSQGAFSQKLM